MFHCHREQCPIQMLKCTLTTTTGNKLLVKEIPPLTATNWYVYEGQLTQQIKLKRQDYIRKEKYKA